MTAILGLSAFYHDAAAALVVDGRVAAAAQEERFSRRKGDERFPRQAAAYCLHEAGLRPADLDAVAFYEKPLLKFGRILETHLAVAPRGIPQWLTAMPLWLRDRLWQEGTIREGLGLPEATPLLFTAHHESHAASAFFPSPFPRAAIIVVDGVGEWASTTIARGEGGQIELLEEVRFPHSLGLLYSAFTAYTGFRVNSGEYKLMGLAPYGAPRFTRQLLEEVVDVAEDGAIHLDLSYFDFVAGRRMTSAKFHDRFGGPPLAPGARVTQREMDLARSIQDVIELAMLRLARRARALTGERMLCLAGGVALNSVANGRIVREGPFDDVWIQPAAGDAGGALGAALAIHHQRNGAPRVPVAGDAMRGALLGPAYDDAEIEAELRRLGARYARLERPALLAETAAAIDRGEVVGWFQGRMEYGPRALGSRSILGDARSPEMQSRLNLKIKFRESFRPFAPAVLADHASEYFGIDRVSPYMLLVVPVAEAQRLAIPPGVEAEHTGIDLLKLVRSKIPAVTHVDGSARVQTVDERAGLFHDLLREFHRRTGCPVVINTSFNVRGEPIVCRPAEAFRCLVTTGMDLLVIGSYLVRREEQAAEVVAALRPATAAD